MPSAWVFRLLGLPRWLQWALLATGVAVAATWLITQLGWLVFIATLLWLSVAAMFAGRLLSGVPAALMDRLQSATSGPPAHHKVPQPAPLPSPIAESLPPSDISPKAALAKGRTAIDALHGAQMGEIRGTLEQLFAALKGKSAGVRNGTLIVLEGPPGTGKFTVAENLTLMLYGIGYVKRPEPYLVEADTCLAISPTQLFDAMSQVAAAATGCVLLFRHAEWLADKDGAEAVGRALSRAVDRQPGMVVMLSAPPGMGERLSVTAALSKAWLGRFSRQVISFPELSPAAIAAVLADLAHSHGLRFDGGGDVKLAEHLVKLSKREGYENAVTVHALFEDARMQAAKRAAALDQSVTAISDTDAAAAIDMFHLNP